MHGSRKFSKWGSSFLVKLNVPHGQVMFYCTDNSILINIRVTVKHIVCPYEQGLSIERVKKLHLDFTDNQKYL